MGKPDLEAVETGLRGVPYGPIKRNHWTTSKTIHEKIKADLQYYGIKQGYQPLPEFSPTANHGENDHLIDIGWFDRESYNPAVAFEIDGGVSQHSVKKLNKLNDDVVKVIISKSPNSTYIRKKAEKNLPPDFEHIDVEVWKDG